MRRTRTALLSLAAMGFALSLLSLAPRQVAAQSGNLTILVAPVTVQGDVDRRFGERIADEVRDALEDVAGYEALDEGDVDDVIDQYDLDKDSLTPIEWRQLAGTMQASLVMVGTAARGSGGVVVDVNFLDPRTGDELPVDPVTVADDRQHEEVAELLMQQFEPAVEYARRIAFCSEYLATGAIEDALNNCNEALALNPGSTRALYLRGRAHMEAEAWGSAVEDLEQVVADDPSNTEALQSLAYTHAQLDNKDRSLELYREYLNFQPDDVDVRLNIAYELANAGGHAEALAILEDGVERAPENTALLDYLVGVALTAGVTGGEVTDPDAVQTAIEALEKVLAVKGENVDANTLTNAVNAYQLTGQYDEALRFSERAIELVRDPPAGGEENGSDAPAVPREQTLATLYGLRAQIFSRQEQYDRAATEFEQALQYNPGITSGHRRLANYKLLAGDTDGAIASFRTAVQNGAEPNQIADALFGTAYNQHFTAGRYSTAIDMFNVALEFAQAPDTAHRIHFFAAYGYFQQGTSIDNGNQDAEACQPARRALSAFRQVLPHLNQAGSYEAGSQAEIRNAVDVQLYRQEQIIEKSC